ncbi:MAG: hypothetical protein HQK89_11705 [Nitrospirae bacterium]|nr:hypothetical protein [Nitrospirota bacterium]
MLLTIVDAIEELSLQLEEKLQRLSPMERNSVSVSFDNPDSMSETCNNLLPHSLLRIKRLLPLFPAALSARVASCVLALLADGIFKDKEKIFIK